PQTANAVHGYDIAAARARIAQRVEDGNARAHEWPRVRRRQFIGNRRQCGCRRDHMLAVPAVEIDARDFAIDAHREITASTLFALKAMSTMPAHADALAVFPLNDTATD